MLPMFSGCGIILGSFVPSITEIVQLCDKSTDWSTDKHAPNIPSWL